MIKNKKNEMSIFVYVIRRCGLFGLICLLPLFVYTQSPDSRVCYCFATSVSPDFMLATKAIYGKIGVTINRNDILKPGESETVRFIIPKLDIKQGCGGVYKILIRDNSGATVFETEDSYNEFSYTFSDCNKTYNVQLMATALSPSGSTGNCSRSLNFYVKPLCNTANCYCDPVDKKQIGYSKNLSIEGKVVCLTPTDRLRRYSIQYTFVNKTSCSLKVESITVLGQSLGTSSITIPQSGRSTSYNLGFSTPLSQSPPSGSSVNISVSYKLNDKACTALIKIPYTSCNQ